MSDSKDNLSAMPFFVTKSFGYRLHKIQEGKPVDDMKPVFSLGRGVYELRENFDTNAYRLMYVVYLEQGIYVLDAFIKKSKSGIGLPKPDVERIQARLKRAIAMDKETR